MDYVIDVSSITDEGINLGLLGGLLASWWWLIVLALSFVVGWDAIRQRNKAKYFNNLKHILLAIDVPKENEQNLKAVEQIFAALHGVESHKTFYERNILGEIQDFFSMEIISIEGHVQFIVRTREENRDLVESAIYAQYSDAAITEVEDDVNIDVQFPSEEYELYGTAFKLYNKNPYPIRTHISFEHSLSQSFVDPMASILEIMSNLRRGEQLWLQFVITPAENDWIEEGDRIVNKLIDEKVEKKSRFGPLSNLASGTLDTVTASLEISGEETKKVEKKKEQKNKMQQLTPGQRSIVESIEEKTTKLAFRTKFRYIYLAEKGVYSKPRGVAAFMGGIKQFNILDMNGFAVNKWTRTKVKHLFKKRRLAERQRRILSNFRRRVPAEKGSILNIEELATLYHFPLMTVKAPTVQKTVAKRAEPPMELPLEASAFERWGGMTRPRKGAQPPETLSTEETVVARPVVAPPEQPETPKRQDHEKTPNNLPFIE